MFKVLVILPALNEEKTIESVLAKINEIKLQGITIDTLVIDDGSTDATSRISCQCGVEVVRHDHNRGVGAAFQTGLKEAILRDSDILVNIDSDGQFDPRYIPDLIQPIIREESDFVTASRFLDGSKIEMPRIKKWGNRVIAKLVSILTGHDIKDASCGFRAFSRAAFINLSLIGKFTYTHETILNLAFSGFRLYEVSVPVSGTRQHGKSRVASNLFQYTLQSLLIIIRCYRDYRPMATFGIPGLAFVILGLGLAFTFLLWSAILRAWYPKIMAFIAAFCLSTGFFFFLIALLADMFTRLRMRVDFLMQYLDAIPKKNTRVRPGTDGSDDSSD